MNNSTPHAVQPHGKPLHTTSFDPNEYRRALGSFPTGVAIMTTRDGEGEPAGLTCNSFSSVSLDPPLVLWSLRKASKSIDIFREAKSFATSSILKKFENVSWSTGYSLLPLIDDCVARFHCDVSAQHDAGDHIIFLGQVVKYEMVREGDPLVFYKGAYAMLTQTKQS